LTTVPQALKDVSECALCGSRLTVTQSQKIGISKADMEILRRHLSEGTFPRIIQLLDIVMGKLDPERLNNDLNAKNAISEILRALGVQELAVKSTAADIMKVLDEIRLKIAGPAVGKIGEAITIKDFKAAMPTDDFTEEKADKHGSDIVATIKENRVAIGKIAISVKYVNQWKSEFLNQMQHNMRQEGSDFGILATEALPREALSTKLLAIETSGDGLILVVKHDYASVAYHGMRLALIAWERAKKAVKDANDRTEGRTKIFNAVAEWANGQQLKDTLDYISSCRQLTEETESIASQIQDHTVRKIKRLSEMQQEIRRNLTYANEAMEQLKHLLSGGEFDERS